MAPVRVDVAKIGGLRVLSATAPSSAFSWAAVRLDAGDRATGGGARVVVRRALEITSAATELGVHPTDRQEQSGRDISGSKVKAMLAARAALPEHDGRRQLLHAAAVQACLQLTERPARTVGSTNLPTT
jgi:hypothetical protein